VRAVTYTLTFPDGKQLIAKGAAAYVDQKVGFEYSGAAQPTHRCPTRETLVYMEWYLAGLALNNGAAFDVQAEGDYDVRPL